MSTIANNINTYADLTAYNNDTEKDFPNVSYIEEDDIVMFAGGIRYEEEYFTIKSLEDDNAVKFKLSSESGTPSTSSAKTISVSTDDGKTWTDYTSTIDGTTIATLNMGEKVLIKGNNSTYYINNWSVKGFNYFTASNQIDVYGNIMSLIYGDDFKEQYSFPSGTYNFSRMFENSPVVNAENLILPATTLRDNCYQNMFQYCTSLTTAPELPARTLADGCYNYMFDGCRNLTTAPELPATTLANDCYNGMFQYCTSLTTAPALPARTLATYCYQNMFRGCSSLTTAPELPARTLADGCYNYMFDGCRNLTTAPELPATTLANGCYNAMFSNTNVLPDCSNIDFTSEVVVSSGGLRGLFSGTKVTDSDLERILPKNANGKYCLPATKLATYCYQNMFQYCTSLTTAPELPATTLANSCYNAMFLGCSSLTTAPELPATTLANDCYNGMFNGCSSLTTAPELPATTLATYCYQNMFRGCSSLTTAPELPARTLVNNCYNQMFLNCTKLNYIKALFTSTPSASWTSNWVSGVASRGTFVKYTSASWTTTGVNGVPTGWTVQRAYS